MKSNIVESESEEMNESLLLELENKLLYQDERRNIEELMKKWLKPVVEQPISTTNYVLSKRIQQNMKRTPIME